MGALPVPKPARIRAWSLLLSCGAAGLLALGGCSSGGSGSTSSLPSWASALGKGVTVTPPQGYSPGHDSPGAVVSGLLKATSRKSKSVNKSKSVKQYCDNFLPGVQSQCTSVLSTVPASDFPYAKNAAVTYVAVKGDRATVGLTGTLCTPGKSPECVTNTDPAAVFATAGSFAALWKNANANTNTGYTLAPCKKVNGKWYIDES